MRRVRWMGAAVAAFLFVSVPALAQAPRAGGAPGQGGRGQGGRGGGVAMMPVDALAGPLKLTAQQKTQITQIQQKHRDEIRALMQQRNPENREKMRGIMQTATREIEAVLTPDQKAKLQTVLREMAGLRMVGIPLTALNELKLTGDQKTKIAAIAKDATEKMRGIAPQERREKGAAIRKEAQDKVSAILTSAQKAVIEKHRNAMPGGGFGGGARRQRGE